MSGYDDDREEWYRWRQRERQSRGAVLGAQGETRKGWSSVAKLASGTPNTSRFPEMFETREDGTVGIRVTCRSCRVPSVMWLEHEELELRSRDGDPNGVERVPAAVRNTIPPAALRSLAVWCCERCSLEEEAAAARKDRGSEFKKRLGDSRIPRAMAEAVSWETMLAKGGDAQETEKRQRAIDVAREWSLQPKPKHALLFHGPPGAGKTRLAATAAVARLSHSPITWVSIAVLMAELDAAWSDGAREQALKVLTTPGPVVLDDIDKIAGTTRSKQFLYTALDKREQAGERAIIMTANGKPRELEKSLGDVLMSRITGMCHSGAGVLSFPGPDRRLEIGEGAD